MDNETDRRRDEIVKRMLATPPKPHKPPKTPKPKDGSGAPDAREPDPNNPDSGEERDPR